MYGELELGGVKISFAPFWPKEIKGSIITNPNKNFFIYSFIFFLKKL